jgi:hypothetical protein
VSNEAAERLEASLWDESDGNGNHINYDDRKALLREALAAERRATMERYILAMKDGVLPGSSEQEKAGIEYAALWLAKTFRDEEAAR